MMMQISTSVQQTTEVVALKPAVITLRAAIRVIVYQDTLEMDTTVLVNKNIIALSCRKTASTLSIQLMISTLVKWLELRTKMYA